MHNKHNVLFCAYCDLYIASTVTYLDLKCVFELARRPQAAKTMSAGRGSGSRVTRTRDAGQGDQRGDHYDIVGLDARGMAMICETDMANPLSPQGSSVTG